VWRGGTEQKNHGRQESREALTEEDIGWLDGKEKWKDLRTIIVYRRRSLESLIISTLDDSLAKNIAAPPKKGSQYNRWGGLSSKMMLASCCLPP
jgi:hypothetical protein